MSEIKLYILEPRPIWVSAESGNGDWVRFEDYEQTRKELEEAYKKINFLLERETSLEVLLNEANMERLKPFVLRSEMDNIVGLLKEMNSNVTKELEETKQKHESCIERLAYAEKRWLAIWADFDKLKDELEELQDLLSMCREPKGMTEIIEHDESGNVVNQGMINCRYLAIYTDHSLMEIWDNAIKASRERSK